MVRPRRSTEPRRRSRPAPTATVARGAGGRLGRSVPLYRLLVRRPDEREVEGVLVDVHADEADSVPHDRLRSCAALARSANPGYWRSPTAESARCKTVT